ncbi:MAG: hypothetical protein Q7K16_00515 [Candidatus Azambacteria bacterium]|nr:hypothetical protein [Candidatus Azambacteria bacterium]
MKLYLAIIGHTATGKESCYIAAKEAFAGKLTVSTHHFSDPLNEVIEALNRVLDKRGLKDKFIKSRPNQQDISTELRKIFGEDLLGNSLFKRVLVDPADIVFLDGVRRPKDVEMLKKLPNSFLGYVYAPPEEAYKRLVKRNDRPGDAKKTWEQFLAEQSAEAESLIGTLRPLADFALDNYTHDPEFKFLRAQVVSLIHDKFNL